MQINMLEKSMNALKSIDLKMIKKNSKLIVLCMLFLALIIVSFLVPSNKETKVDEVVALSSTEQYQVNMEKKLENILSSIDGVGECSVAITLQKSECKIFAKDSYEDERENKYEYVILSKNDGSDDGLVVSVVLPEIRGVAVVCEGGDSSVIVSDIPKMCMSLFDIEASKVSVSKMK